MTPALTSRRWTPSFPFRAESKRILDLCLLLFCVPVWLPLLIMTLLLTRLFQGPGVFFCQDRVGRGGRIFRMWKIRTMVPDAEARLPALVSARSDLSRHWADVVKLPDDPRVTRWGMILRRYSLDELPQLWNVLRGEMSLVGPRPVPLSEFRDRYAGHSAQAYLCCRPGLGGLWQVSGRNALSYEVRLRLDRDYAASRTLIGDLGILLRTVAVACRGRGI